MATARPGDSIGQGLVAPLRRTNNDFEFAGGDDLLKSNVQQVVQTTAASEDGVERGEYPWRLSFGSKIHRLRHANIRRVVNDLAVVYAAMAVARWEPRAVVLTDQSALGEPDGSTARVLRVAFVKDDDVVGGTVDHEALFISSEVSV